MAYNAFMSYSHAADGRLAPAVQTGLQRLARPWYRRWALRVFRDDTGLTVNPHLWASISAAMDDAEWFVLLASPEAAASPWVNREIRHWLASKSPDTILPVLTDGTLTWDAAQGDFDRRHSSALPESLFGVYADEPRYLDLRWAREQEQLDLRDSRFRAQIAELAAPIHGKPRDELEGEDVRLHRKAIRLAWGAAIALLVLTIAALVGATFAVSYASTARSQRRVALNSSNRATESAREARAAESQANAANAKATRSAANERRSATEARDAAQRANQNEQTALKNADAAKRNADEATRNAEEAARNLTLADANATRANNFATDLASANTSLSQKNADLNARGAELATALANLKRSNTDLESTIAALHDSNQKLRTETVRANDNARVAVSRQLAAQSLADVSGNLDRALLEAVAGETIQDTKQGRDSLSRAVLTEPRIRRFVHPSAGLALTSFAPDGRTLATLGLDSNLELWDVRTGRSLSSQQLDDASLVSAGPRGLVAVQTSAGLAIVDTARHAIRGEIVDGSNLVAFSPDGASLAVVRTEFDPVTGDPMNVLRIWNIERVPVPGPPITVGPETSALRFSPDGKLLAWAQLSADYTSSTVVVYDIASGSQTLPSLPLAADFLAPVSSLAFDATTNTVQAAAVTGADAVVQWSLADGHRTRSLALPADEVLIRQSPNGRVIAKSAVGGSANDLPQTLFVDVATKQVIGEPFPLYIDEFSPDGDTFAGRAYGGVIIGAVRTSDSAATDLLVERHIAPPAGEHWFSFSVSPDGSALLASSLNHISVIAVDTGATVADLERRSYGLWGDPCLAPHGGAVVIPTQTGVELFSPGGAVQKLTNTAVFWVQCAFSLDGSTLVLRFSNTDNATTSTEQIWRLSDRHLVATRSVDGGIGSIVAPAISPDGARVANLKGPGVELWTPANGDVSPIGGEGFFSSMQFSAGGNALLLNEDFGGTVTVWSLTGEPLGLPIRTDNLFGNVAAISADGSTVATTGSNSTSTVQMWDVQTGVPTGPPLPAPEDLRFILFAASGDVIAGGFNGVTAWRFDTASLLRHACLVANRDLTPTEWTQLVGDVVPYQQPCADIIRGQS